MKQNELTRRLAKMVKRVLACLFVLGCLLAVTPWAWATEMTPQEVYAQKQKALEKLDVEAFNKLVTPDIVSTLHDAKDPRGMLFLIRKLKSPIEYKVIKEDIKPTEAVLYLEGKAPNPQKQGAIEFNFGKAIFRKEGNAWKYNTETWQKDPLK
jgi:hypothetical protein